MMFSDVSSVSLLLLVMTCAVEAVHAVQTVQTRVKSHKLVDYKDLRQVWCKDGIRSTSETHTQVCCAKTCGTCGGSGCASRKGGGAGCCDSMIKKKCKTMSDVRCLVPEEADAWTYYAEGCGGNPYLATMTGSFDQCATYCLSLPACFGFQQNNQKCYLDDDTGEKISGRVTTPTSKEVALAAPWHCAIKRQALQPSPIEQHGQSENQAIEDTLGNSNADCNNGYGQTNGPFTCHDEFACVNIGYVVRFACQACRQKGYMSSSDEDQCRKIAQGGQTNKGLKVSCKNKAYPYERSGCVHPVVSTTKGWTNWGETGTRRMCPCVKGYVDACKNQGISCVLGKIDKCPHVCTSFKERMKDAQGISLIEAKGENELKERASVSVDSRGKASRNASASMMSLDHAVSGKCSQ